jgi:S1-C subfamily serine protease
MKTLASTLAPALLGLMLLAGPGRPAEPAAALAADAARLPAGEDLYARAVPSVAWVVQDRGLTGTGWVVDREQKRLLTNFHVVADGKGGAVTDVRLVFPAFDGDEPIAERSYYEKRLTTIGVHGLVVHADAARDLAVIEADVLPKTARALPLAAGAARPGERVWSIGNPAVSEALFVFNEGTVRSVYRKDYRFDDGQHVIAKIVETQDPINPGDSGSPLMNRAGEVVAVNNGTNKVGALMSLAIELSEVRVVLEETPAVAPRRTAHDLAARGDAARRAGKYDDAVESYTAALKADPTFAAALAGRAAVYNQQKDYEKAIKDCDAALALDAKNTAALKERAFAHRVRGETDRLLTDYELLTDATPDDLPLYLTCADMHVALGDLDAALEDCTRALDRNKDFADGYEKRGDVYAAQKRYDQAAKDYRDAAKKAPGGGSAKLKDKRKQAEAKLKEASAAGAK